MAEVIDRRFRTLYDTDSEHPEEVLPYALEDLTVASYLGTPSPSRIPAAIEAVRQAALLDL